MPSLSYFLSYIPSLTSYFRNINTSSNNNVSTPDNHIFTDAVQVPFSYYSNIMKNSTVTIVPYMGSAYPRRKIHTLCYGCLQRDWCLDFWRRHILEQFIGINVGQEKRCVDRDLERKVFYCPFNKCDYKNCDADVMKTHLMTCPDRPKNLSIFT